MNKKKNFKDYYFLHLKTRDAEVLSPKFDLLLYSKMHFKDRNLPIKENNSGTHNRKET